MIARRITARLSALDDQHLAVHAAMRTNIHVLGMLAFTLAFGLVLPSFSAVSGLLGVSVGVTGPWAVLYLSSYLAATTVFRRSGGRTPLYLLLNRLETLASALGVAWLVTSSAKPDTLLWALLFSFAYQAGTVGSDRVYTAVTLALGGFGAAAMIAARGQTGAAMIGGGLTIIALVIYLTLSRAAAELARVINEREHLQKRVAELQVHEERSRIARDLHDGLGSELSALIWSARSLQGESLTLRVHRGLEELRQIVWALRTPDATLDEAIAHLRTQTREQCGDRLTLSFEVTGVDPKVISLDGERRLHIVRTIQEAVRNAVRHSQAQALIVRINATQRELTIVVADDGRGIPSEALLASEGGLANIRMRAARLGGECIIQSAPGKTELSVRAPL